MYNQTVKNLRSKESLKGQLKLSVQRSELLTPYSQLSEDMKWLAEVPWNTKESAITEAIAAYKGCLTKLKNKQIKKFKIKYKTKKQNTQIFKCCHRTLLKEKMSIFVTRLKKNSKLKMRKRDFSRYLEDDVLDGDFTVMWVRPDQWYICLPKVPKRQPTIYTPSYKSVFLDPGVRTFQTFYSPDGICGKIGDSVCKKVVDLSNKHDNLWSISSKKKVILQPITYKGKGGKLVHKPEREIIISSITKKKLRDRCAKIRYERKNVVSNLHNQTVSFLTKNFETILLPKFDVKQMTKKSKSLKSKISKRMLDLCHGEFRVKLLYQSQKRKRGCFIIDEPYTTKTCGNCGNLKEMNSLKKYKCKKCGCCIDRDYNGARNICLRFISKQHL